MKQQRYLLDTNICAYILRGKYDLNQRVKDFKNINGIQIENWIPDQQK